MAKPYHFQLDAIRILQAQANTLREMQRLAREERQELPSREQAIRERLDAIARGDFSAVPLFHLPECVPGTCRARNGVTLALYA